MRRATFYVKNYSNIRYIAIQLIGKVVRKGASAKLHWFTFNVQHVHTNT